MYMCLGHVYMHTCPLPTDLTGVIGKLGAGAGDGERSVLLLMESWWVGGEREEGGRRKEEEEREEEGGEREG